MKKWLIILCVLFLVDAPLGGDAMRVGVILPLSGHTSNYGIEALRGITVAVESINERGGVKGQLLELVVKDNASDPAETAQEVTNLILDENVLAVIGPITSTNSAAAAAVCQQHQTPLVLPTATSPYVTEIGEYISRICFTDPFQSRALAKYSRKDLRADRVAIIYEKNSAYSEQLAEFYGSRFEDMGGEIVFREAFQHKAPDNSLIAEALAEKPDRLFLPVYYPDAAVFVDYLIDAGESITVLGGDGFESPEFFRLSKEYEGSIFISSHFSKQFKSKPGSIFMEDFQRTHNDMPNALSALGYDAAMVLADALRRATTMTSSGIRQALVTTSNYSGATGQISINEKRNAVKNVFILKAVSGQFVYQTMISSN